jgi:peptidoglycan/LPS O-acetylase OafA/YrhL
MEALRLIHIGLLMFLAYINSFRAVAIVFIVAGHCIPLFEWERTRWQDKLITSLISNGTVFFVFIAGFLFQHLSHKFKSRRYLKTKFQNVLLPYLIVSLPVIMARALGQRGIFDPTHSHHWPTVAQNVAWSLLTGNSQWQLWFIPMIVVFYVLAPPLLWIDRDGRFYYLLPILLAAAVCVHRPSDSDHIWHSCAYFLPVYLYGMWFSRHRDRVMAWHDRWLPALLILVMGLVWLEVGYLHRAGFIRSAAMFSTENGIVDTNALQKLLLCGAVLSILRRFGKVLDHKLNFLAHLSFGIYFLHMYFIKAYLHFVTRFVPHVASVWLYCVTVATVLVLSVCCLCLAKLVLGRHSRSLVGC